MNNSPLFEMSDPSIDPMLSPIARGQLRSIAARAMEETENEILKFFDEAIKKPPEDVVIVGLCLWRLALLYRTMMKRYKLILYDACIDRRRERQKVMYEAMTTGYSLVYRRSAPPCSPAWRMEDHLHFFGDNADLVDTFLQLQVADKKFYEENINDDDDFHARKLLWERMVKGGRGMKGR
ncbi:uncharacterized protein LY89DRAFT_2675 [Mollisia scopiformis]|uniref:Uncharacterized protein n=1 Tax=Mollisia scopiformis TaxID=149040 RepID=A0A194XUS0_MOLSC|nr:uncharacterized protein LY89DRAFT_2675 [Mollisia scopiformis]KUJ23784.1 hypothetical protein LY89DRAFT_2675 [Mollisia scopiformis]